MADKFTEIGAILAAARRDRGKSLKDAEESTKIMASYLEAIEAGQPERLPAPEYFMLFTRSYAQYLGVDPAIFDEIEETAAAEKSLAPAPEPEQGPDDETITDEPSPQTQEKKFGKTVMYVVIGIVVVFAAFIVYTQIFMESDSSPDRSLMSETGSSVSGSNDIRAVKEAEFSYPDQPWQPPEKLRLKMIAKQNVWAVVARDGDTVMNRELLAGQQRQWEADYRYSLTVGISSAIDLFLNDKKLRPLSDRARTIKDLEINQVNYAQFLSTGTDQEPIVTSPTQEKTPPQPQQEEESWIERRPEPPATDTGGQQPDIDTTTPAELPEDDSWIEPPPRESEPDTSGTEAPDGG